MEMESIIDPNTFTVETYCSLVRQMHIATTSQFDKEAY